MKFFESSFAKWHFLLAGSPLMPSFNGPWLGLSFRGGPRDSGDFVLIKVASCNLGLGIWGLKTLFASPNYPCQSSHPNLSAKKLFNMYLFLV